MVRGLLRLEYKNRLRENQQSTSIIYTQASTNKILIASDFCFLQKKKKHTSKNLPKKRHGNVHFIILCFVAKQIMCCEIMRSCHTSVEIN